VGHHSATVRALMRSTGAHGEYGSGDTPDFSSPSSLVSFVVEY